MAKTSTDYLARIASLKASYLDGLWSEANGWYQDAAGLADSVANASMVQIAAILANEGAASATDKSRAATVITKLLSWPAFNALDGTWWSHMNGTGDYHAARDEPIREGLYYAYLYRTALGLDATTISNLYARLTTDSAITDVVYGSSTVFSVESGNGQVLSDWQFNAIAYAHLLGVDKSAALRASAARFLAYLDGPKWEPSNAYTPDTLLLRDFGWWYIAGMPWNSWEYGAMCYGKMVRRYPELSAAMNLSTGEIALMKAWQRHHLGQWQRNGYPNWDTSYSDWRLHSTAYWMWGLQALIGMVRATELNQGASDHLYAKWMLDAAIDTWDHMDTWGGDAADGVPPDFPFGTVPQPWDVYSASQRANTWGKHTGAAKFAAYIAQAVDLGVADASSADPGNLWGWQWTSKAVHVSTPAYDAASLPYAPAVDIWGWANHVQLQHWGISRIAKPTGEILTATGGYQREAFSFLVSRSGITDIDTGDPAGTAPSQTVYVDGVEQGRTDWDTSVVAPSFSTSLRSVCTRTGTNYRVDVDTTFTAMKISSTHRVTLTGGTGPAVAVMSVPARKDPGGRCTIKYVASDDSVTTVWDGSSVTPAGSPDPTACKYIHVLWPSWDAGLLIVPRSATVGAGAKVTAGDADPATYPRRQPDQDRSLLIYLSDTTETNVGDMEIVHDYALTDGTDAGAAAMYATLLTPAVAIPGTLDDANAAANTGLLLENTIELDPTEYVEWTIEAG